MKFNDFRVLAFTFAVAATSGLAQAGQISFNDSNCQGTTVSSAITCSASSAGVNYGATVSAWSAAGTGKFGNASMVYYDNSGLGISSPWESTTSPEHAIDNNGATEALLISFGTNNVALNQLSLGWAYNDADVSILRYTGTQAPVLGNSTVANLTDTAGWEWVGDYANLSTSSALSFNSGDKAASWWLVSAYNSAYSGVAHSSYFGDGNDYFKVSGFGGNVIVQAPTPTPTPTPAPTPTPTPGTKVPEPGTFALFGIALLGCVAARRKSKAK
ncbi:putative secreted protein with PEP-CTERM sorting signal [Herbaspirillum sp. SJZ107]|nr:exosortase-dependent surface protein XDP1 [Herbaspirillum sp. SJZ107]TQK06837.1 putative secreted protein with PEP-CTERM sorting signal [Herbaspirillum sp. SJZ107]